MTSQTGIVTYQNTEEIAAWCGGCCDTVIQRIMLDHVGSCWITTAPAVNVPVGDTVQRAQVGDVVIRKHDGSFEVHKQQR